VRARGNNIGAGERLCRNSGGIVELATRPELPTCTVVG
jgi:hypothetical protein